MWQSSGIFYFNIRQMKPNISKQLRSFLQMYVWVTGTEEGFLSLFLCYAEFLQYSQDQCMQISAILKEIGCWTVDL